MSSGPSSQSSSLSLSRRDWPPTTGCEWREREEGTHGGVRCSLVMGEWSQVWVRSGEDLTSHYFFSYKRECMASDDEMYLSSGQGLKGLWWEWIEGGREKGVSFWSRSFDARS